MKTLIAVPCMDTVAADFAESFALMYKPEGCSVAFQKGSLIYDARNHLAVQAIKGQYDYVLWLDSDMVFPQDMLLRMMEHMKDKDIISGLYFRRVPPYKPVLYKELNPGGDPSYTEYDEYPSEPFMLEGIGFGCVLMKTAVLVTLGLLQGGWFSPVEGFGEDLSFCIRAKNAGYKIWCDPSISCGHIGHSIIDEKFYKSFQEALKNEGKS